MHDNPSTHELLTAVKRFIDETAAPELKGHAAFHARVASNALATVMRDIEARASAEDGEHERLVDLLGADGELADLNAKLCDKIVSGEMSLTTPGLLDHLKTTAIEQLKVDQPKYSGLKTALVSE